VKVQQGDQAVQVWFMDEARIGQKGRNGHRWWPRGERAPGLVDQRYQSTYLYAAVRPTTDEAFALVLPEVNVAAMEIFLDGFAASLPANTHAILIFDRAGWHGKKALRPRDTITFMPLPSYSPQLNPTENVFQYLRENFLSHRILADYNAAVDAAASAWNRLRLETNRITSICSFPWIAQVVT